MYINNLWIAVYCSLLRIQIDARIHVFVRYVDDMPALVATRSVDLAQFKLNSHAEPQYFDFSSRTLAGLEQDWGCDPDQEEDYNRLSSEGRGRDLWDEVWSYVVNSGIPVSYTHLDVYKRQILIST